MEGGKGLKVNLQYTNATIGVIVTHGLSISRVYLAISMAWCGYMLSMERVLRMALETKYVAEADGARAMKVGFSRVDTICRSKWIVGVIRIPTRSR